MFGWFYYCTCKISHFAHFLCTSKIVKRHSTDNIDDLIVSYIADETVSHTLKKKVAYWNEEPLTSIEHL